MNNLFKLSLATLAFGAMLGASACTACMPQVPDTTTDNSTLGATSYRCGAGTHLVGTQCIGNSVK